MSLQLKPQRPDKLLQKSLIMLAYAIIFLSALVILFVIYPQYRIYTISMLWVLIFVSSYLAIKTLKAGEDAISYGGFANEIIKDNSCGKRIDSADNTPIMQNDWAKEFFKNENVLDFIEKKLSDQRVNKTNLTKLKLSVENLRADTAELSLFSTSDWFEVSFTPIFLKKADIFEGPFSIKKIKKDTYLSWNIKDITAQKNMEHIFQDERNSLRDFLDNSKIGLFVYDKDYQIQYANHYFANILDTNKEHLCKMNFKNLFADGTEFPSTSATWQNTFYLNHNSHNIECKVVSEHFRDNGEIKTRGIIVSNFHTQNDNSDKLNLAMDKISWLFNLSPVGILIIDEFGKIRESNSASQKLLGQPKEHLTDRDFFDFVLKDNLNKLQAQLKNPSGTFDLHLANEKIALTSITPMQHFYSHAVNNGFIIYLIDATERKTLENQFAQAQKMQAMGQLAGGIAHDFNNLLTAMIGFCDLLLQRHGVGDPSFADLIQVKQNAIRATGLVRQLLAFSRKQPLKPKLIDVTENFVELSHTLKRTLGEQITLNFRHGSDLGFIRVDPVQFSQVIINLAVNAKDAMSNRGTLTISTRVEKLTKPYQFGEDTIKPGIFVAIDVKDSGCGINEDNLNRIFEPFFSTKQNIVGSGTGLGLSMVYGIVRQTEGFIKVESKLNSGTTFSIYLPRFESNAEEISEINDKKTSNPALSVQTIKPNIKIDQKMILGLNVATIDHSNNKENSSIRILFVEDEDSVRAFGIRALQKKGYEVIACNCAENALEKLEEDNNFNLLITDMVMPGISGAELANIVKNKIENIKIILASGYSEEIAKQELANDFAFLAKPFSLGDLAAKVSEVLSEK